MNDEPTEGADDVTVGFAETPQETAKAPPAPEPAPDAEPGTDEAPEGDPDASDEDKRRRSKPAHVRIAELTAKLRQAERDLAANQAPKPVEQMAPVPGLVEPDPNSDAYEFGEADPKYLRDLAKYEVKKELAEERQLNEAQQQRQQMTQVATTLDDQWKAKAEAATEKYPDYAETVLETAAAGEWPCPPILAMAISASDQGSDIAYHLATNRKEAEELAGLAQSDPFEAVRRFGRLEARFEAKTNDTQAVERKVTKAPEPPTQRARGGSGQFTVADDTDDLDAFSNKFFAKK